MDESIDSFREKCKENNLKITPQRIVIYREMLKSKDHPNAEVLHERIKKIIPDISLRPIFLIILFPKRFFATVTVSFE